MGLCEEFLIGCRKLSEHIDKLLRERSRNPKLEQEEKIENARIEKRAIIERQRVEKLEKETRKKEWHNVKDEIYSRHQLPIADDAKNIARDLLKLLKHKPQQHDSRKDLQLGCADCRRQPTGTTDTVCGAVQSAVYSQTSPKVEYCPFGKNLDSASVFFVTDERVVRQIYIEGGDKAIDEYAKNLNRHAFIGGPITATLLRRLKLLEEAKRDGKVIDTEIDIDGFVPFAKVEYAVDEINLDGQIIPARRKFSIRCEMTATLTEGFRTGPFVLYDDLYLSTKEEIEQITDEDIDTKVGNKANNKENKDGDAFTGEKYGKRYHIEVCPHGTDVTLYCNQCHGDIILSPSKKKVIGICLDISGSMQRGKLSNAKKAVIKVLERIPVNSNIDVVLIIFSTDLRVNYEDIIPFGTKYTESIRHMAIERINDIIAGGSTPLYDTINYFLDRIWSGEECPGERILLDENRIFFPYTYLIIVSDGEENQSILKNLIYNWKIDSNAFFAKLKVYRDAGLVTEIIPFAYGDDGTNIRLIRELRNISGKKLINEICPDNIIESLVGNVDSILYGADNLKMMGLSISKRNNKAVKK